MSDGVNHHEVKTWKTWSRSSSADDRRAEDRVVALVDQRHLVGVDALRLEREARQLRGSSSRSTAMIPSTMIWRTAKLTEVSRSQTRRHRRLNGSPRSPGRAPLDGWTGDGATPGGGPVPAPAASNRRPARPRLWLPTSWRRSVRGAGLVRGADGTRAASSACAKSAADPRDPRGRPSTRSRPGAMPAASSAASSSWRCVVPRRMDHDRVDAAERRGEGAGSAPHR